MREICMVDIPINDAIREWFFVEGEPEGLALVREIEKNLKISFYDVLNSTDPNMLDNISKKELDASIEVYCYKEALRLYWQFDR